MENRLTFRLERFFVCFVLEPVVKGVAVTILDLAATDDQRIASNPIATQYGQSKVSIS